MVFHRPVVVWLVLVHQVLSDSGPVLSNPCPGLE